MTWGTILGALGLLLVGGLVAWYKLRTTTTDAALAQDTAAQADKAAQAAEDQLVSKAKHDKEILDEQIDGVLAQPKDKQERAALDLLARVRGTR